MADRMTDRSSIASFRLALRRARAAWQAGLLLAALFDTLAVAGMALLLAVLADLLFAQEDAARRAPGLAAAAVTALAAVAGLVRAVRFRDAHLYYCARRRRAKFRILCCGLREIHISFRAKLHNREF